MEIYNDPPPEKRTKQPRITNEMRQLKPGQSVIVDPKTAACIASYMRYNSRDTSRQTIGKNLVRIWILQ